MSFPQILSFDILLIVNFLHCVPAIHVFENSQEPNSGFYWTTHCSNIKEKDNWHKGIMISLFVINMKTAVWVSLSRCQKPDGGCRPQFLGPRKHRTRSISHMQIMEHTAVNGSVHTACKQHQRVSASPSRVNGALRFPLLTLFFFFFFFLKIAHASTWWKKITYAVNGLFSSFFFLFVFAKVVLSLWKRTNEQFCLCFGVSYFPTK